MPRSSPSHVRPAAASADPRLRRLEQLSHLLDDAIRLPGVGYRIGYDALIGLLPGVGDLLGTAISAYIVLEAARFRLPFSTVLRMVLNVGLEALLGTVPLVGDVFDAAWKANVRNMALLRAHLGTEGGRAARRDRRFVGGVAVVLVLLLVAVSVGTIYVLKGLAALLGL